MAANAPRGPSSQIPAANSSPRSPVPQYSSVSLCLCLSVCSSLPLCVFLSALCLCVDLWLPSPACVHLCLSVVPLGVSSWPLNESKMSRIAAILPAAGMGTRMGAETPKQFLELDGAPLVIFTLRRLAACEAITEFFIATRAEEMAALGDRLIRERCDRLGWLVCGGGHRQESVANALAEVSAETEIVLVHDAVRPFVTREQIERVIAEARARHAVILGIPAMDTVKEVKRAS